MVGLLSPLSALRTALHVVHLAHLHHWSCAAQQNLNGEDGGDCQSMRLWGVGACRLLGHLVLAHNHSDPLGDGS